MLHEKKIEIRDDSPILFVTIKVKTEDVVKGFRAGGNDYIRKPFRMEELIARINNVLRNKESRASKIIGDTVPVGQYLFRVARQSLSLGGIEKRLSFRESELLKLLYKKRDRLFDRKEILNRLSRNDSFQLPQPRCEYHQTSELPQGRPVTGDHNNQGDWI